MKVVLVMFRDGERREFALTQKKSILGRRSDCHLRIPTGDVSRQHCEIEIKGDALLLRDLGSSNGTYVNGKRIAEARLKPGDQLTIGPATFTIQIDGKPANIQPGAATSTAAAPATAGAQPKGSGEKKPPAITGKAPSAATGGRPAGSMAAKPATTAPQPNKPAAPTPGKAAAKAPQLTDDEDTENVLELGDIDFDDPISALESFDNKDEPKPPKKAK